MTTPLETLTKIVSRNLIRPVVEIDVDVAVQDLGLDDDDYWDLLEEACQIHGACLPELLNSMPLYRARRSDLAMDSLRDLAAFSQRAADMLAASTFRVKLDTLRSLASTLENGRYVESGLMSDDIHQPSAPIKVIGKGLTIFAVAVGVPMYQAFKSCAPFCKNYFASTSEKFWNLGIITLPLGLFVLIFWLGPGIYELVLAYWKKVKRHK